MSKIKRLVENLKRLIFEEVDRDARLLVAFLYSMRKFLESKKDDGQEFYAQAAASLGFPDTLHGRKQQGSGTYYYFPGIEETEPFLKKNGWTYDQAVSAFKKEIEKATVDGKTVDMSTSDWEKIEKKTPLYYYAAGLEGGIDTTPMKQIDPEAWWKNADHHERVDVLGGGGADLVNDMADWDWEDFPAHYKPMPKKKWEDRKSVV